MHFHFGATRNLLCCLAKRLNHNAISQKVTSEDRCPLTHFSAGSVGSPQRRFYCHRCCGPRRPDIASEMTYLLPWVDSEVYLTSTANLSQMPSDV